MLNFRLFLKLSPPSKLEELHFNRQIEWYSRNRRQMFHVCKSSLEKLNITLGFDRWKHLSVVGKQHVLAGCDCFRKIADSHTEEKEQGWRLILMGLTTTRWRRSVKHDLNQFSRLPWIPELTSLTISCGCFSQRLWAYRDRSCRLDFLDLGKF